MGLFLWLQFMASKVKSIAEYVENYNSLPSLFKAFEVGYKHTKWAVSHIINFFIDNQHTHYVYICRMYGEQWIEDILAPIVDLKSKKKASFARKIALMILDFENFKNNPNINPNIKKILKAIPDLSSVVLSNRSMKRLINHIHYNQSQKRDNSIAKVLLKIFYSVSTSEKSFLLLFGRNSLPKEAILKKAPTLQKKSISFKTLKNKSRAPSKNFSFSEFSSSEKDILSLPQELIARIFSHVDSEDLFVLGKIFVFFISYYFLFYIIFIYFFFHIIFNYYFYVYFYFYIIIFIFIYFLFFLFLFLYYYFIFILCLFFYYVYFFIFFSKI